MRRRGKQRRMREARMRKARMRKTRSCSRLCSSGGRRSKREAPVLRQQLVRPKVRFPLEDQK
eukprot:1544449-Pyramimonas_sp.AAC.1